MNTQAQTPRDIDLDNEAMYFDINDMPNAVIWLPAPPDNTRKSCIEQRPKGKKHHSKAKEKEKLTK